MPKITPTTVIASLALFFSLGGASLAASHYLITSVHQIAPLVRHELRGDTGLRGPAGPQGQQGPQGARGSQGPAGDSVAANTVTTGGQKSVVIHGAETVSVTVPCPSGDEAVGGAYHGLNAANLDVTSSYTVTASRPTPDGHGWTFAVRGQTGTQSVFNGQALCLG